ncbi:MAG: NACHT domain-containing protein [Okeania sp. SIO3B5]|uniref:WD40 domain-containing protein n=1 Tax=Okeania sp. SIO3B5 TaxID=2607811 RepID=UPI001400D03D|nr:NB-ARC domain-containing protein [Okeania sp. SIO3B5]NEO58716.1 NACHT domain-containing protein [Okeania sp. SIO3B5]
MVKINRKFTYVLTKAGKKKIDRQLPKLLDNGYSYNQVARETGLHRYTVTKILKMNEGVTLKSLRNFFSNLCLDLKESDYKEKQHKKSTYQDWGDAPDIPTFFGRETELKTLKEWILQERCRLIAIIGIGGIGKTAVSIRLGKGGIGKTDLSLHLARDIQDEFEFVIWRSLINAPPITEIIADLIQFISRQKIADLPDKINKQISLLLDYLKQHRCLLILDNVESILASGDAAGKYQPGYEEYGQLLSKIASVPHESCLLLTSREKINNIQRFSGKRKPVRLLELTGLNTTDGRAIFEEIGDFIATDEEWQKLIEFYNGNPLALELAAHHLQDYPGSIAEFLTQGKPIFADLRELLDRHFERLSDDEKEILYWLVIHREPISITDLKSDIVTKTAQDNLSETLSSLQIKIPLEKSKQGKYFTLQPVLIEYVTEKLITSIGQEIKIGKLQLFNNHSLLQAQAKDYIRNTQIRIFIEPIAKRLIELFQDIKSLEDYLLFILENIRQNSLLPGYIGGNVLNLFCYLKTNLKGYNFSYLTIRQAYLQGINLHDVNFSYSDLTQSIFTQSFGGIHSLAFSPDGKLLAAGDSNGLVRLLKVPDGQQIATFQKHGWWVLSIAYSPDGEKLVSSSIDGKIKMWNVATRKCINNLEGHTNWIFSLTFSPDAQTIASGCNDHTIKLWDANTGECIQTLEEHKGWVLGVAFSPDGKTLASASADKTIKLWNVETFNCIRTLTGSKDGVWSVAFTPDGEKLASCGYERIIRLWNVKTGKCDQELAGHQKEIKVLAFSPDGKTLASACFEPTVKFWNVETGGCIATGKGHQTGIRTLSFCCDNKTVATGNNDQVLKLWDAQTGKCVKTFQGYTDQVWSVAFSPDGKKIASSHLDYVVRIWDVETGECLQYLRGHKALIWSVVFSPDGKKIVSCSDDENIMVWDVNSGNLWKYLLYPTQEYQGGIWTLAFSSCGQFLASAGQDATVKIWNIDTEECRVLSGHQGWVWKAILSPDDRTLASSSDDQTIKIWDFETGECLKTLRGHTKNVRSIAFSPDGKFLVSGSEDTTLRLWDVRTGECLKTLRGHKCLVWPVKFSANGKFIVSGAQNGSLKLWDACTGECWQTLKAHNEHISSVDCSEDSKTVISGSLDGTVKFWDVESGECLRTLRVPRPYEGMNITGVKGLTEGNKEVLKALGAVEDLS